MASLNAQADRLSCSTDAIALAWLLAKPWVDVVLSGAACIQHLKSNLLALDIAWDREAEERLTKLAEPAAAYWGFRKSLAWN